MRVHPTLLVVLAGVAIVALSVACGGGAQPTPVPTKPAPTAAPAATKPAAAATTAPAATKPAAAATTAPAATKPAAAATTAPAATKPAAAATTAPAATKPAAAGAGNVAAGQAVFTQNCNGCHPGGDRGVGPVLKGRNLPADRIRTQVRNGGGQMPPFPASRISDQQLTDLVAYVQSLK